MVLDGMPKLAAQGYRDRPRSDIASDRNGQNEYLVTRGSPDAPERFNKNFQFGQHIFSSPLRTRHFFLFWHCAPQRWAKNALLYLNPSILLEIYEIYGPART